MPLPMHGTDVAAVLAPLLGYPLFLSTLRCLPLARLKPLLATRTAYNVAQALYSLCVATIVLEKLVRHDRFASVHALVCVPSPGAPVGYYLSKWVEFYDGALILAAGKAPTGLQVRHHSTAASLVWLNTAGRLMPTPLYDVSVLANAIVHAVMYAYFAFPRALAPIKQAVTTLQIAQFVAVIACILTALAWHRPAPDATSPSTACDAPGMTLGASLVLYTMMMVDFVSFYVSAYPPSGSAKVE